MDLMPQRPVEITTQPGASGHACNPSYSGGGDQRTVVQKPVQVRPYLEKTHHKKGLVEWLKW
jgi:hypothetical protein